MDNKNLPSFEDLKNMAKQDPEKFELLRRSMINNLIEEIENKELKIKLERLQFKIDGIIFKSSNPLEATIKISKLMNEKFLDLNEALNGKEINNKNHKNNFLKLVKKNKKEIYKKEF